MGHRQVEQAALFYEFSLERHIPPDHLLRSIDRFVEFGELRRELTGFYSSIGRPLIDSRVDDQDAADRLLLMSSSSQRPPRIFESSPNSFRCTAQ